MEKAEQQRIEKDKRNPFVAKVNQKSIEKSRKFAERQRATLRAGESIMDSKRLGSATGNQFPAPEEGGVLDFDGPANQVDAKFADE